MAAMATLGRSQKSRVPLQLAHHGTDLLAGPVSMTEQLGLPQPPPCGSCCFSSSWTRWVSCMTKGASFSPASFQLEAWRQLKMRAGSTSSAWVPGHPCFSHQVCAISVLPEKQNQQEIQIKSHYEELAYTESRLGYPKSIRQAIRKGRLDLTDMKGSCSPKVESLLLGSLGSAFQRMESDLPRIPKIIFLT